jgi:REP element-mobilizing transposase RayT
MPRRLRIHQPGGFYHATLRGNHQQQIFFADGDRLLLNMIVARAIDTFGARLHAYCWMTNHLHFLIQVGGEPLARPMRQIAAEFARAMQLKLETTGHYFERRYHATLVDTDAYLLELLRYIHLNPVRAGLVDDPARFRWSSHHDYIGRTATPWLTTDFGLRMFSADRARAIAAYREFLQCPVDVSWDPATAMNPANSAVLGSDEFLARIQPGSSRPLAKQTLPDLIVEACSRFEVDTESLRSPLRDGYLVKVRAWIAHQAQERRIATLAAVARELERDEATLRYAMRAYPTELE